MKSINPYLIFNGNAEEAFGFYENVFDGKMEAIRFSEMSGIENLDDEDKARLAHVALPLSGTDQILMASDSTSDQEVDISPNGNVYITLEPDNKEEAERIFNRLSAGGQVIMPLERTEWAELFAMFSDRFGIKWMINYGER